MNNKIKNVVLITLLMLTPKVFAQDALSDLMKKYANKIPTQNSDEKSKSVESVEKKEVSKKADEASVAEREPASRTKSKPQAASAPKKAKEKRAEVKAEEKTMSADQPAEDEEFTGLFGDWGGLKKTLGDHGIAFGLAYKGDYVSNMSGGLENDSYYLGNADVTADFDLEKLVGLKGFSISLYGLGTHGDDPTEGVADSFATSNIEAPNTFKLYEAYVTKKFDDKFSLLVGLRDLNADFYATESSGAFLNSAFGISPVLSATGENGPSIFPQVSLAATVKYEGENDFYFQSGAFNALAGKPDHTYNTHVNTSDDYGYLYIWELGYGKADDEKIYKYGLGAWNYTQTSEAISTEKNPSNNYGFYALIDQPVTSKMNLFLKAGMNNDDVNTFERAYEFGMVYRGVFNARPDDVLGLGVATVEASNDYVELNDSEESETAIELVYTFDIGYGMTITPDYQYVVNPSLDKNIDDAQVGSVRFEIEF